MRKMQKPPAEELRKKKQGPLAEGLRIAVPIDSRGRVAWSRMSDKEIVEYAKKFVEEKEITTKRELSGTKEGGSGLYKALKKRGLLDLVGFEVKKGQPGFWTSMDNEELVKYSKKLLEEFGISGKTKFRTEFSGLSKALERRGLLEELGFEEKQRDWSILRDEEIVRIAKKFMKERGIAGKTDLHLEYDRLWQVLNRRKLVDLVGFETKRRNWASMSNEEIVELARKVMEEKKILRVSAFEKADPGLLSVLAKRSLLNSVGFEFRRDPSRRWSSMCDETLFTFAQEYVFWHQIKTRCGKGGLEETDVGLYSALRRRKLLDRVFFMVDKQKDDQARQDVIDALEAFAANDNDSEEDDVA
ncbi:hypothetical protein KKE92_06180 [Candidatus Micrarchaeota archaeon]|nr:hypothetical protein [Candidatus Micrarchaeota archaeon]MBU1682195.1 hypothetical protein [Candidatus Micrarchaeota archaeon]